MGIMDSVGYALGAAADVGAAGMMDQFKSQLEQERQTALMQVRQQMEAQSQRSSVDLANEQRQKRSAEIEQGAGLIAAKRIETPPAVDAQADQAAMAYDDARQKGLISQEDANSGYGAAAKYRDENSTKGSAVTADDRKESAIRQGYIEPKDAAILGNKDADREIKAAIASGRFENALQIAQMKGEFGMALGELKAAAAGGSEKATEMMRNWNFLTKEKGFSDAEASKKLLEGKDTGFDTVTSEGYDEKGNKVTRTHKVAAGKASAPESTGKAYVWKDGKLVPK